MIRLSSLGFSALLLLSGAGLSGCITQTDVSNYVDPAVVRPHYKRPNLLVTDLERSLSLYVDVLGFEASNISTSGEDSYSYPVFNIPREATMRYTYLGEPGEARVFGLTEVIGVAMEDVSSAPHRTGHVIGVTDLMGKLTRIKAMGLSATEPKDAGGTEFRFREVAFTDFDGHLIVLYEVLP
jgi:catechol 2,3-dioxygenase-like lactoylglutathione lyase family enzyme